MSKSFTSEDDKLLVDFPSNKTRRHQSLTSPRENSKLQRVMSGLLSGSFTSPSPTDCTPASSTKPTFKQVTFSPTSRLHGYHKIVDNKELCFTKKDRRRFQEDTVASALAIRRALRGQDLSMETDLTYLYLKSGYDIHGIEAEEIIGIEHLIDRNQGNGDNRRNNARAVVDEWRRLCSNCEPWEEEKATMKVAALAKKFSRDSTVKARRRAQYVQWMNDLPSDMKLSES